VAGFIKEVYHLKWLANPVLVLKKNNNEWRMCVVYTNQQTLPEKLIRAPTHRPSHRLYDWLRLALLH
jgi:hypothetical protein